MKQQRLRALCEGAIMIAAAQILGYLKFYSLPYGGSVTLGMVPILFYALRWGIGRGLMASLVYGLLQFALDGAYAYTWQAILLDYLLAYTVLGLAGLFRGKAQGIVWGTVLAVALRFVAHMLSGVYAWAEYMPSTFLGRPMLSPWIYSPLYNGIYMGLNLVLCLVALGLLHRPLRRYLMGQDMENRRNNS